MVVCGAGPKGITITPAFTVAQGSYGQPAPHAYGYEWPAIAGNPPCMVEPDPEPMCPEACPPKSSYSPSPCPSSPCSSPPCTREPPPSPSGVSACSPTPQSAHLPPLPPTPRDMTQPFPPPPLGPRMLRCHHPPVPSVEPQPCHKPCPFPFPRSCKRVPPVPFSTLTTQGMREALMPYSHHASTYQLDYCSPCNVRKKQVHPCSKGAAPLGKSGGIIHEYVGKCGGGPRKPHPRRVYGVMGPPPCKYSFGRSEYQSKVSRLGGALLKCHAKRAACMAKCKVVPYGTAPPCRAPCRPPCRPPCAPCPCPPGQPCCPCPLSMYLGPACPRPSKKCDIC